MPNLIMLIYLLVNKLTAESIKKEAIEFDQSLLECELTSTETT